MLQVWVPSCPEMEKNPAVSSTIVPSGAQMLLLVRSRGEDSLTEVQWKPLIKTFEILWGGGKVLKVGWEVEDKASLRSSSGAVSQGLPRTLLISVLYRQAVFPSWLAPVTQPHTPQLRMWPCKINRLPGTSCPQRPPKCPIWALWVVRSPVKTLHKSLALCLCLALKSQQLFSICNPLGLRQYYVVYQKMRIILYQI